MLVPNLKNSIEESISHSHHANIVEKIKRPTMAVLRSSRPRVILPWSRKHERINFIIKDRAKSNGAASIRKRKTGVILAIQAAILSFCTTILCQEAVQATVVHQSESNDEDTTPSSNAWFSVEVRNSVRTPAHMSCKATTEQPSGNEVPDNWICGGSPSYTAFFDLFRQAAEVRFKVITTELLTLAERIIAKHDKQPYPPQVFHDKLCTFEPSPMRDFFEPEKEDFEKFCLYAYTAAVFVRSSIYMESNNDEANDMARTDLAYAITCLGKEGSVDFLDSVDLGGFSILDIYINLNDVNKTDKRFMTWEEYEELFPIEKIPAHEYGALIYNAPPLSEDVHRKFIYEVESSKSWNLAVFGTHATLSMEPVYMLENFVLNDIAPVYYGLEPRWCEILGMCDRGDPAFAKWFKDAEQDIYGDEFTWDKMETLIKDVYERDESLHKADLLLCTEPLVGCLLLQKLFRTYAHKRLPLLAYMGVALLNAVPPFDLERFWALLDDRKEHVDSVFYVNNRILREQIYYQTGIKTPYVRAHGLYTNATYSPSSDRVLFWRAPLFVFPTLKCAIFQVLAKMGGYPLSIDFLEEGQSMGYRQVSLHQSVVLLPWDHALMTFYELYSMNIPLFLPKKEWIYRFVYSRGQLSVGEPLYQSVHPWHNRPRTKYAEYVSNEKESYGPMGVEKGLNTAITARGVLEDMLTRGLEKGLSQMEMRSYMVAALDLAKDMKFFLTAADNKTDTQDSYTSMGKVKRFTSATKKVFSESEIVYNEEDEWHPYTPFQMSPRDSNEWTRMRKGGWWLRRGVRVNAMRYWFQYSDFHRFPALQYFNSIPDMLCKLRNTDLRTVSAQMEDYNRRTLLDSVEYWTDAAVRLLVANAE